MVQNITADRALYSVLERDNRTWQVRRLGALVSMHRNKTDAIDFAMKHSRSKAVIVVVPKPTEGEVLMKKTRVARAKRKAVMLSEVERKEQENREALQLPLDPNAAVEQNVVKSSADEATPRPQ